jgi:FdrA protein
VIVRSLLRRSAYYDSVTLMRAQQSLRALPGIEEVGVVMGTQANLELLRQAGLDVGDITASPDDLVVAVRGDTQDHVASALAALDAVLVERPAGGGAEGTYRPRTVATAARLLSGANLALISVPGRFAAGVAREALQSGLHVMLFSDNVAIEDEVRLKRMGKDRGLLVMGPDCGTALLGGMALGFANRVRRGPIGLVGAAGTGLQEVTCLIHRGGGGVSHALGTGGRDLTTAVGGMTMTRGMALLGRDPATQVAVLVSKPPDPEVADRLLGQAAGVGKPVVVAFVGGRPGPAPGDSLTAAPTLEGAAHLALRLAGIAPGDSGEEGRRWRTAMEQRVRTVVERFAPSQRYLRGLYSGGTLCAECASLLEPVLTPLSSNVHVGAVRPVDSAGRSRAHTVLDLGDDLFTVGRLHPMLDMTLRSQRLSQEAADPEVAVILLDIVLGMGVHPDPAGALVPAITASRRAAEEQGRHLAVVASVCGTDEDPQHRTRQVERLEEAGVLVEHSNARAVALAGALVTRGARIPYPDVEIADVHRESRRADRGADLRGDPGDAEERLLRGPLRVVNVGLPIFAESLRAQGVEVIDVDWRPPAGGDRAMLDLLERLG